MVFPLFNKLSLKKIAALYSHELKLGVEVVGKAMVARRDTTNRRALSFIFPIVLYELAMSLFSHPLLNQSLVIWIVLERLGHILNFLLRIEERAFESIKIVAISVQQSRDLLPSLSKSFKKCKSFQFTLQSNRITC